MRSSFVVGCSRCPCCRSLCFPTTGISHIVESELSLSLFSLLYFFLLSFQITLLTGSIQSGDTGEGSSLHLEATQVQAEQDILLIRRGRSERAGQRKTDPIDAQRPAWPREPERHARTRALARRTRHHGPVQHARTRVGDESQRSITSRSATHELGLKAEATS